MDDTAKKKNQNKTKQTKNDPHNLICKLELCTYCGLDNALLVSLKATGHQPRSIQLFQQQTGKKNLSSKFIIIFQGMPSEYFRNGSKYLSHFEALITVFHNTKDLEHTSLFCHVEETCP